MNLVTVTSRATTALVAAVAGFSSYRHIVEVAQRAGEHHAVAAVLPLSIDGLILVGTMAMVEDKRAGRQPRLSARVALGVGIVATLAANIASAQPHLTARLVAAVPAVAFLITVEVLARSGRARDAKQPPAVAQPAAAEQPPAPAKAPVFLAPVSAPPAADDRPVSGAPAADDAAGQKVRQDTRSAQQIEAAVCAMKTADPKLSQRKLADLLLTSPSNVRRALQRLAEPEQAQEAEASVNGNEPELEQAPV